MYSIEPITSCCTVDTRVSPLTATDPATIAATVASRLQRRSPQPYSPGGSTDNALLLLSRMLTKQPNEDVMLALLVCGPRAHYALHTLQSVRPSVCFELMHRN